MHATGIETRWVNSDRQLADVLTKPTAPPAAIQRLLRTGRWKIVWDATYTSAKNIRKTKRGQHLKNQQTDAIADDAIQAVVSADPFAQEQVNYIEELSDSSSQAAMANRPKP